MKTPSEASGKIVKSIYFSNWGDNFGFPIAHALLPFIATIPGISPNIVTITSFFIYTIGSLFLFISFPFHLILAALCITFGFIGDDLDGQLARSKNLSSRIGDYLDKVLDVLKIFIITASLAFAVYEQTHSIFPLFLGFIACFFFLWRYYIKLETMFSQINSDPAYLEKSAQKRRELEIDMDKFSKKPHNLSTFWHKHKTIFFVDEAEFALFTAGGALLNQLKMVLLILAVSQVLIASWRVYERGTQITRNSKELLRPMRK